MVSCMYILPSYSSVLKAINLSLVLLLLLLLLLYYYYYYYYFRQITATVNLYLLAQLRNVAVVLINAFMVS